MTFSVFHSALYGAPPPSIVSVEREAAQLSPTMPGSVALEDVPDNTLIHITVFAPPGTNERRYIIAHALRALKPGGEFVMLAPVKKGGSRLGKELENFGCVVAEASDQHHKICRGQKPAQLHNIETTIAEGGPQQLDGLGWTQPGIFSWDRIDDGSAALEKLLPDFTGAGADLGCGNGFLAKRILASKNVARLVLVDNDRRAIECAKKNITDARAEFMWADMRSGVPLYGLDFVVMNPPFHSDGLQDHSLGLMFIERAAAMLRAAGSCWLVANKHLPYEAAINKNFNAVTRVREMDGFKIYELRK